SAAEIDSMPLACMNKPDFNRGVLRVFGGAYPGNVVIHTSGVKSILNAVRNGKVAMLTDSLVAYAHREDEGLFLFALDAPPWGTTGLLYAADAPSDGELRKA